MLKLTVILLAMVVYKGDDYWKYSFLSRYTRQYDLVLSDFKTILYVSAFGGKVIAKPPAPLPCADYTRRQRNLVHSFDQATTN